ncbi:MAG TPA: peptide deformylase [Thermoanaerobaculia bacterium]|nr:peptide deformylase [Thermoanaerobaculia bacterium]
MGVRPIVLYPDPILRQRCRAVDRFDEGLRRLAGEMVATLHSAPGVGLAAPQVGSDQRLFVVDLSVGEDPSALHVLVNPVLVAASGSQVDAEGCLSIPGLTERVARPAEVRFSALGLDGRPFELAGGGLLARALCHELDHLDGVLFVDRLRGLRRELARRRLRRLFGAPAGVPARVLPSAGTPQLGQ